MNLDLISGDNTLKEEIERLLPDGWSVNFSQGADRLQSDAFLLDSDYVHLLDEIREKGVVLLVSKHQGTKDFIEAGALGAFDVIPRPITRESLGTALERVAVLKKELNDVVEIGKQTADPAATCVIVGSSYPIQRISKMVGQVSQVDTTVLITGETGTGKEIVAETISQLSPRFGKPFEVINCAAIPEALLESELFGYEKGAFTGAVTSKPGRLLIADEGTVFFDEIGELSLLLQSKLLRFLQTQTFHPVGSNAEVRVDVRVIAATNKDLAVMVREGKFREDLYYRISVVRIHVPPLRERRVDIVPLVHCMVNRHSILLRRQIRGVTRAFVDRLHSYDWPGNIRELENVIRSAISLAKTPYLTTLDLHGIGDGPVLRKKDVVGDTRDSLLPLVMELGEKGDPDLRGHIHDILDRVMISYALERTGNNQSRAAKLLGMNRITMLRRIKDLNI